MDRLKDRVAVITGGAKGMGAAMARLFTREGALVVIADVAETEGRAQAAELGATAMFQRLDVGLASDWEALLAAVLDRHGRVDALVNNAGVVHFADFANLTEEAFDRVQRVNVKGTFLGVKIVGGAMAAAGRGAIVNFSSIDGLRGSSGVAAYVTSKWAVRGLTRSAALEFGHRGVRVNSIHPGGIDTEMGNPMRLTGAAKNHGYEEVPLQRMGEPGEVAAAALFLCSDDASYICGAELAVDGGWNAGHYHTALPGAPASIAKSMSL